MINDNENEAEKESLFTKEYGINRPRPRHGNNYTTNINEVICTQQRLSNI